MKEEKEERKVLLERRLMKKEQMIEKRRKEKKKGKLKEKKREREEEREIAGEVRTRKEMREEMIDNDDYKVVNDTYGHLVGDKALRAVRALREQLRSYDLAGRYGGEEFAILLPQTREAQALRIAERLRTHNSRADHPGRRGRNPASG